MGVTTPGNVRSRLGIRYSWLEEAFARAYAAQYLKQGMTNGNIPSDTAGESMFSNRLSPFTPGDLSGIRNFVRAFVEMLQRSSEPPKNEKESYLQVPVEGTGLAMWERAHWIDGDRLERDLAGVLEYAWYEDSPDTPRNLATEAILRRNGAIVALVDSDRRFLGLVDRYALLDQMSKRQETGSNKAEPIAS